MRGDWGPAGVTVAPCACRQRRVSNVRAATCARDARGTDGVSCHPPSAAWVPWSVRCPRPPRLHPVTSGDPGAATPCAAYVGWEHPGRAPGPVLKPSGSSSPTSLGSSRAGPAPPSSPALCHGHRHCCTTATSVPPLCHGHHHRCATLTVVPWPCLCHGHHCAMVVHPTISRPSATHLPMPFLPPPHPRAPPLHTCPGAAGGSIPSLPVQPRPPRAPQPRSPGCVWFGSGRARAGVNPALETRAGDGRGSGQPSGAGARPKQTPGGG